MRYNVKKADIWVADPPFGILYDYKQNPPSLHEYDIFNMCLISDTVKLMNNYSNENSTALICCTISAHLDWKRALIGIGWSVYDSLIIGRPYKCFVQATNEPYKDPHSYWVLAWKGKRFENLNIEEYEDEVWPERLANTNALSFHSVVQWHGSTENGKHFRICEKSPDLMTKLISLLISKYNNQYSDNICIHDPFMGTGTTGAIAKDFFLHFVGNDVDLKAFEVSRERIIKRS